MTPVPPPPLPPNPSIVPLLAHVVVVCAVLFAIVAIPHTRRAIARWFRLSRQSVHPVRIPEATPPTETPAPAASSDLRAVDFDLYGRLPDHDPEPAASGAPAHPVS